SANGTAPSANHPTTGSSSSRRLNHTRLPLPTSCATVRIGIASRTPNIATSAGNSTAAPPNPATAASVLARSAAPPSSSHCVTVPPIAAYCRPCRPLPPIVVQLNPYATTSIASAAATSLGCARAVPTSSAVYTATNN